MNENHSYPAILIRDSLAFLGIVSLFVAVFSGWWLLFVPDYKNLFLGIGNVMAGIGSLGLLLLALIKLPAELQGWKEYNRQKDRDQRRRAMDLKKSEVAAQCLIAFQKYKDAFFYIANPFSFSGEGGSSEDDSRAEEFAKMFNSRLETARKDLDEFYTAKKFAIVYLDTHINSLLDKVSEYFHTLRTNAQLHASGLEETERILTYQNASESLFDHKGHKAFFDKIEVELDPKLRSYLNIDDL